MGLDRSSFLGDVKLKCIVLFCIIYLQSSILSYGQVWCIRCVWLGYFEIIYWGTGIMWIGL
ncbi:hypothetical protein V1515DRAFT_560160 [Lipomyces mesembrius]